MQRYTNTGQRRVTLGMPAMPIVQRSPTRNSSRRTSQAYTTPPPGSQNDYSKQNLRTFDTISQEFNSTSGRWADNTNGFIIADENFQNGPPAFADNPNRLEQINALLHGASNRSYPRAPMIRESRAVSLYSNASSGDMGSAPYSRKNESHPLNDQPYMNGRVITGPPQDLTVSRTFAGENESERDRLYGFHADNYPPFVDVTRGLYPSTLPVIRIENAPYNMGQTEVAMWMAKHMFQQGNKDGAHTVSYPIHILMDRATGKSMDIWLELPTQQMADQAMDRYYNAVAKNAWPRISNRVVTFHQCTQGDLMKALFPNAKDIHWDPDTGIPILVRGSVTDKNGEPVSAFRGFLSREELFCCFNHSVNPMRVTNVEKCPQRGYECMLATLMKYPWASTYYTIGERDTLFQYYFDMLKSLITKVWNQEYIEAKGREVGLSVPLARTYVNAGLRCPGFSERQKFRIVEAVGDYDDPIDISEFCRLWPFQSLSMPIEVRDEDVAQWMHVFDHGCHKLVTEVGSDLGRIRLGRDDRGFWFVTDKEASKFNKILYVDGKVVIVQPIPFCDFSALEYNMMKRIMKLGWESWFSIRQVDYVGKELSDRSANNAVMKKMMELGCFEEGGIERPVYPRAGDDVIHLAPHEIGIWHDLMACTTTEKTPSSAAESLGKLSIFCDPETEAKFQSIQSIIRGEAAVDNIAVNMSVVHKFDVPQKMPGYRPGHGSWHPDVIAGKFNLEKSPFGSEHESEDEKDHGVSFNTPRAPIPTSWAAAPYSAPQSRVVSAVNFGQIARQAVATKSGENTPTRLTGNECVQNGTVRRMSPKHVTFQPDFNLFAPVPANERGVVNTSTVRAARVAALQHVSANDPFVGPAPRSAASEPAGGMYAALAQPQHGTISTDEHNAEDSPSRRARSASPRKNSYTIADIGPRQDYGPIGTPSRRRGSLIVPEPTVHEDNEGERPTSASSIPRGRGR